LGLSQGEKTERRIIMKKQCQICYNWEEKDKIRKKRVMRTYGICLLNVCRECSKKMFKFRCKKCKIEVLIEKDWIAMDDILKFQVEERLCCDCFWKIMGED
jgi:hypothetical protein